MSTANYRFHVVRLVYGVSGHCGVCAEHGIHDHFDDDLKVLICGDCKDELKDAEIQSLAWMVRGVEPLEAHELLQQIESFNRSGARMRPRVAR